MRACSVVVRNIEGTSALHARHNCNMLLLGVDGLEDDEVDNVEQSDV